MQSKLNPYINFKDNAREALEFYKTIFGGKIDISTYGESEIGEGAESNKVMHGVLEADNGINFMVSDTPNGMSHNPGTNVNMSLSGDNEEELKGYWDKLAEGGTIRMPISKAPWGDTFGMLTDKFGIEWMVNISGAKA